MKAKHAGAIADQLHAMKAKQNDYIIDDNGMVWRVMTKHSGFILACVQLRCCIPYWTCYKVPLPNLQRFDMDKAVKEKKRLLFEVPRPTVYEYLLGDPSGDWCAKDGDQFIDCAGMQWTAKASRYNAGLVLEGYDNEWLPSELLPYFYLRDFELLRTKQQIESRSSEFRA
ncbi:MAG: hypothetical protein AAGA75_11715 [Cyanobacteria bacterium P01_E01_bin.6]